MSAVILLNLATINRWMSLKVLCCRKGGAVTVELGPGSDANIPMSRQVAGVGIGHPDSSRVDRAFAHSVQPKQLLQRGFAEGHGGERRQAQRRRHERERLAKVAGVDQDGPI